MSAVFVTAFGRKRLAALLAMIAIPAVLVIVGSALRTGPDRSRSSGWACGERGSPGPQRIQHERPRHHDDDDECRAALTRRAAWHQRQVDAIAAGRAFDEPGPGWEPSVDNCVVRMRR